MRKLKKGVSILLLVLAIWSILFTIDFSRVAGEQEPIFCVEMQEEGTFVGLGYSFCTYQHSITGKIEFAAYLFGINLATNFTN